MVEKAKLNKSGYKRIITIYLAILLSALLFFGAAGRLDLPRAWFNFALLFLGQTAVLLIFLLRFPGMAEVVNARGEVKIAKGFDRFFIIGYTSVTLLFLPVVAGLDVGRYRWSLLSQGWIGVGVLFYILAMIITGWALLENRFFETTVRIQEEREHEVITTGPYAIVRHPGYVGMIFFYFSQPLVIGSFYALSTSLLTMVFLVIRTVLEDSTLQKELPGYGEYTKKTRYRLIPFVW